MGEQHQQQLAELHEALTIAVTDIVRRWWTDNTARYPERMPLDSQEEELLQWIETQVESGNLADYSQCRGSWRPDFLVGSRDNAAIGQTEENFRITEINARFSFNGALLEAHGQQALDSMGMDKCGLKSATNAELRICDYCQMRMPKVGYKLCAIVKETSNETSADVSAIISTSTREVLQEVHQIGLELRQQEFRAIDPEILRQTSSTSWLRRGVLSTEQAKVLDRGIADTILPGSPEIRELLH
ncbi:hypothetical protein QQS21_011032 [Conoideocrella luteorostrata]|uniref:Uncharacterized protein n=1 Tax=Conoideocrella luteorostrata TaxID=1105319 RepID=A0AAJ0CE64_9HYPO|nr:hypothetical protein QQS21_011032 [Conoideocrella luteorostrata]